MLPLTAARREPAPSRRDPAPSRLKYRLNRLWLRPRVRTTVNLGVPLAVGLLAGWVSVAAFANIAGAARLSGAIAADGAAGTLAAVMILLAAGGFTLGVLWLAKGSPWYAAAVAWALIAILYANTAGRELNIAVAIVSGALAALVVGMAWQLGRMRRRSLAS